MSESESGREGWRWEQKGVSECVREQESTLSPWCVHRRGGPGPLSAEDRAVEVTCIAPYTKPLINQIPLKAQQLWGADNTPFSYKGDK